MSDQDDIQQALTDMGAASAPQSSAGTPGNSDIMVGVLPMPEKRYVISCLWWGIRQSMHKVAGVMREHPWAAALGLGVAIACGKFACIYFGFTVLAGLMILALRAKE